ncbi:DEAD/DEAH box helicase family protein [Methylobacterium oxalidis]|uniref:DEAD/DEAH box helicase family protein n=1 Tax=Methylobacterium oxalidis TaxID=944322 RepID=UPI0033158F5E
MAISLFDALAGAGKTRSLVRYSDALARKGRKVLFIQPTKLLISKTIEGELLPLDPSYPYQAIHSGTTSPVVPNLSQHFKDADPDEGEIVFATHAAFFMLRSFHQRKKWTLIVDEVPAVDVFKEFPLADTHDLITEDVTIKPEGINYGLLVKKDGKL